jgi:Helix-turn-helix domain
MAVEVVTCCDSGAFGDGTHDPWCSASPVVVSPSVHPGWAKQVEVAAVVAPAQTGKPCPHCHADPGFHVGDGYGGIAPECERIRDRAKAGLSVAATQDERTSRPGKPPETSALENDADAWFLSGQCKLSASARWVLIALIRHYNPTEKKSRPSEYRLATWTGLSRPTVSLAINELEAAKAIKVVRRIKSVSWYRFTFPRHF